MFFRGRTPRAQNVPPRPGAAARQELGGKETAALGAAAARGSATSPGRAGALQLAAGGAAALLRARSGALSASGRRGPGGGRAARRRGAALPREAPLGPEAAAVPRFLVGPRP